MRIVLIGAGNLMTSLSHALQGAGHDILQVFSRTSPSADSLAQVLQCEAVTDIHRLNRDADVYILAVKDSVLPTLAATIGASVADKVLLHTAGSVPMDVFAGHARHYGVLYPMQTFSKRKLVDFSEVPCFVEGNDEVAAAVCNQLANDISNKVYALDSASRKYLHLSAVFACNFANHCYAVAASLLQHHGIPFEVMLPLLDETTRKVHQLLPAEAQSGPAVGYDENVLRAQEALLDDMPLYQQIYRLMSKSIHHAALDMNPNDRTLLEMEPLNEDNQ